MSSLILRASTRILTGLILSFSLYLLWRGHNLPGGGFIGGLVASIALALAVFAFDARWCRRTLPVKPTTLAISGLGLALAAGLVAAPGGETFLTGTWTLIAGIKLGTPLLFDLGVYLAVLGSVLALVLELAE
jgi:multisubunit Na+/H+ antiporter MnhB subunit